MTTVWSNTTQLDRGNSFNQSVAVVDARMHRRPFVRRDTTTDTLVTWEACGSGEMGCCGRTLDHTRFVDRSSTIVNLGRRFRQPIRKGVLPRGLTHLELGGRIIRPIKKDRFIPPDTRQFPPIEEDVLPYSLTDSGSKTTRFDWYHMLRIRW